jgi:hypothetical protein
MKAKLSEISFTAGDRRYELTLGVDVGALQQSELHLDVTATVSGEGVEPFEETLTVEIRPLERRGRVLAGDRVIHEFDYAQFDVRINQGAESPPGMEYDYDDGPQIDKVAEAVESGLGDYVAGLIDAMPVPDPIFGCLLKAGISSTIGQAIACTEVVGLEGAVRQVVWRLARCMRDHIGGILTRTLWRTARCIVTLGMPIP